MKNVLLIHGYSGIPDIYNWLKDELSKKGLNVLIPEFPSREDASLQGWTDILSKYKKEINSETIIVAHSIGNELIIKYLSQNNLSINMFIGLSGFTEYFQTDNDNLNKTLAEFLVSKLEIEKFIKIANKKYCIYSDNDHIVPFSILEKYPTVIKSKSILIKGIGHMGKKSGLKTIPEVLEIINKEK